MSSLYTQLRYLESSGSVCILMYHGFTEEKQFRGIQNYGGKHLHIAKFEEQIQYLNRYCRVIRLEDFVEAACGHKKIVPLSVILTMDDGYGSNYALAYPILKRYCMPATIFISTDFIEKKDFLYVDRIEYAVDKTTRHQILFEGGGRAQRLELKTVEDKKAAAALIKARLKKMHLPERERMVENIEDDLGNRLSFSHSNDPMYMPLKVTEIRKMSDEGLIACGSHTCSHISLAACSPEEIARELRESRMRIEEWTGRPCDCFSFPYGKKADINGQSKAILAALGFRCSLTTIVGANDLSTDIYKLKRLNIHNDGTLRGFVRTLSPFGRFLRKVKNGVMEPFRKVDD